MTFIALVFYPALLLLVVFLLIRFLRKEKPAVADSPKQASYIPSVVYFAAIPVLPLEYFMALWVWWGDGGFNMFVYPPLFLVALVGIFFLLKKVKRPIEKGVLWVTTLFLSPITSGLILYLIAHLLGIDNHIE